METQWYNFMKKEGEKECFLSRFKPVNLAQATTAAMLIVRRTRSHFPAQNVIQILVMTFALPWWQKICWVLEDQRSGDGTVREHSMNRSSLSTLAGGCCRPREGSTICPIDDDHHEIAEGVYEIWRMRCDTDDCNIENPRQEIDIFLLLKYCHNLSPYWLLSP